jgi:type 1 glutamine amidotransferase/HEAT repeat protein
MKTNRLVRTAAGLAMTLFWLLAAGAAAAPIRIVILSGANVHDWKATTPLLEQMYADPKKFKVVEVVNDVAKVTDKTFAKCDVIVSNWTCHPVMTGGPWTPEGRAAFEKAIRGGVGMVSFHAACAACNDWADFQEISGLTWKWAVTSHTSYHTFKVVINDAAHPITRGLPDFWITDELYQKMARMSRSEFKLLASAFAEADYGGTGAWEPMLITTRLGKGRGVNFLLGHDVAAMRNPAWQTIMLRCTEWAATGQAFTPVPGNWPVNSACAVTLGVDPDEAIRRAAGYAFGQARQPLFTVEQLVIVASSRTDKSAAADRAALAAKLAGGIALAATAEARSFFCGQLALVGTPDQVATIAPLVADEKTAMQARAALERIPGPAAGRALCEALAKLQGTLRLGVINSLGNRGEAEAVSSLAPLLSDPDEATAAASAAALGRIGTSSAAEVLKFARSRVSESLRPALTDAYLACAEHLVAKGDRATAAGACKLLYAPGEPPLVRAAALHGLALAQPTQASAILKEAMESNVPELHRMVAYIIRTQPRIGDTKELANQLMKLPPASQTLLLAALGDRGDKAAAAMVRRGTVSDDPQVSLAALAALARLGNEADVALLTDRLANGDDAIRAGARAALVAIPGLQVTAAIADTLASGPPALRGEMASILVARGGGERIQELLGRPAALADASLGVVLIGSLKDIGDAKALKSLEGVRNSENPAMRDAALEALAAWPTADALGGLVSAIRDPANQARRPALLASVVRLLPQAAGKSANDKVALLEDMLNLADRPEDRRVLLSLLGDQPSPQAMRAAMKWTRDGAVADAAGLAAVKASAAVEEEHRDEVRKAMQELIAGGKSPELIKAADAALRKASRPLNLARKAVASSPDDLESDGAAGGDQAGIDGLPATYWDEVDNQKLYRYRLTWKEPVRMSAICIKGHAFESHCPRDFEILCDDQVVKTVQNAVYDRENVEATFTFPPVTATTLELKITGYYAASPAIRELEVYDLESAGLSTSRPAAALSGPPAYGWKRTDTAVALLNHGRVVWQFNYAREQPKTYFSPLNLVDGTELVWLSPPDHPWHFALWFSWKELNELNYWEQWAVAGQGRTEVTEVKVSTADDYSARFDLAISYHPEGKPAVLTERRVLRISPPGPDGSYHIDWSGTFTAGDGEVRMKGGTAGGGYAGMSARMSRDSRGWELLDSEQRRDGPCGGVTRNTHGRKARWADFSLVSTTTGSTGGLAILDHPGNLRYPSQWHDIIDDKMQFGYFSPAPLWSEPYTLPAGKQLTLRYRILVHPGRPDAGRLEEEFKAFSESP